MSDHFLCRVSVTNFYPRTDFRIPGILSRRGIHFQNAFSNAFQLFVNQSFAWAFSGCGEWGLLFVAAHGLLFVVASPTAECRLQALGLQELWPTGSAVAVRGL